QLGLTPACQAAAMSVDPSDNGTARAFFERWFRPFAHDQSVAAPAGLTTGYFEPHLQAAAERSAAFPIPIHARPADLVPLIEDRLRGANGDQLTYGRQTPSGVVPYATRAEIDSGAIDDVLRPLFFLRNTIDRFFLQVQGSGLLRLDDGTSVRVGYDGKNGHPYTSIGAELIRDGEIGADAMTLDALRAWLSADTSRGDALMARNASYVFFKTLEGAAPEGACDAPLTPLRSLAVDAREHAQGLPVYLEVPELAGPGGGPLRRLMIAQDVGSAIRGPERCDIYFGSGDAAGAAAGSVKHAARFFVLRPTQDGVD
ncbi:MAG: murein transglycosylase A, partial [Pseudomonadota bacterium]